MGGPSTTNTGQSSMADSGTRNREEEIVNRGRVIYDKREGEIDLKFD